MATMVKRNGNIYDKETGKKMYPVCGWYSNQHKMYNALDRAHNDFDDTHTEKSEKWLARVEDLVEKFDNQIVGKIVYMLYEDYATTKDIIGAYDMRH